MKIVVFSDVHANLPALESFFKDVELINPDAIYCLGDLVGYNVWANEVVSEIRKRKIPTIMGNHDEALLNPIIIEEQPSNKGLTRKIVNDDHRNYLINLPRHLSLSFVTNNNPFNLLMVHGSTKSITDYMFVDYQEAEVIEMMEATNTDVLLCGHTHKPFHRIIQSSGKFKHIINVGSVGKPKDGDARLCYAILELNQVTNSTVADSLKVAFNRVEYDVEKAAKAVEESQFENKLAEALRLAK